MPGKLQRETCNTSAAAGTGGLEPEEDKEHDCFVCKVQGKVSHALEKV